MTTNGSAAARELAAQVDPDRVLVSGPAYEDACRIWNGAVDHRPALIVQARTVAEVQAAVRAARKHDLPLSVRGGGHDWAGRALRSGGLVIDLTRMRHVEVDGAERIATVAGGATAGDVIAGAAPHGLVAATGTVGGVGLAGLTLAGGYGPLNGRFGLALDNLLGADLVLADGRLVTTDATHEPELYWAIRGGGGNFGVVTSMRVRLHPVPQLLAGLILFPWDQAPDVWRGLGEVLAGAPDELTVQSGVVSGPDGSPVMFLSPAWSGEDLRTGEKAIDELQRLGTAVLSQVAPMTYGEMLGLFDSHVVSGRHYAIRTRTVAGYTPDVVAALVDGVSTRTSPNAGIALHHAHGATTRVAAEATAFGLRRDHFVVEIISGWEPDSDATAHQAWTDNLSAALAPHALPGGYANLLGPDDHDQITHAYGQNATRLLAAKAHFDPNGIFSATPLPDRP
ncbi:FAD-binding oxidoreductase [Actinosynnema sp. CS-041913]|uniref:FAD-binding oxidoreductase n=1 Tax=Actinosynnema sp. CS-041913 TaxID=3239917 RepID=UPI003D8ED478